MKISMYGPHLKQQKRFRSWYTCWVSFSTKPAYSTPYVTLSVDNFQVAYFER